MGLLRGFLNWVVAGATAGGIIGSIGAAYKFIDDSMKPNQRENEMFDRLLADVPVIASLLEGNKRGDPEEEKHWKSFLETRRQIQLVGDSNIKSVVVSFTIAHDALPPTGNNSTRFGQIGNMSEDLASCIRYASFGAPRALEWLTGGRVLLVSHGRCSAERVAYLDKVCPPR